MNNIPTTYYDEYYLYLKPWLEGEFDDIIATHKPFRINNVKIMAQRTLDYFVWAEEKHKPISQTNLILFIGLGSRNSFDKYIDYSDDFKELIRTIKLIIENYNVNHLYDRDLYRASSFILRTNYNYMETSVQIVENKDYVIDINNG